MKLELVENDDETYDDLSARFEAYNASHANTWNWKSFCLVHKEQGRIVAGGRGIINLGALEVSGLWVDENLRGKGIGKLILREIEKEARARGAKRAMLFTYSWQAQQFYENAGYKAFGQFEYPDGHMRIDLQKDL